MTLYIAVICHLSFHHVRVFLYVEVTNQTNHQSIRKYWGAFPNSDRKSNVQSSSSYAVHIRYNQS